MMTKNGERTEVRKHARRSRPLTVNDCPANLKKHSEKALGVVLRGNFAIANTRHGREREVKGS
jgi:predicted nucleic acid-binding Zn ribbon protein